VSDVRQGVTTGYYESGELKSVCNYKDGELDGIHKILYPDGLIKELTYYKNGIDIGIPE
jgi:antitoxin component YwqK of YwqJK toxin-antitoxin module